MPTLTPTDLGASEPSVAISDSDLEQWWKTGVLSADALNAPFDAAFSANVGRNRATRLNLRSWLLQLSKVRPRAAILWESLRFAEARGKVGNLQVAQFPDIAGESWAGNSIPVGSRKSCWCWSFTTTPKMALVVDGWSETVPGTEENGGITLHWNAPSARAPQVIALGLPDSTGWTLDTIEALVTELRSQCRLRGVQPSFGELAELQKGSLPLSYLLSTIYSA